MKNANKKSEAKRQWPAAGADKSESASPAAHARGVETVGGVAASLLKDENVIIWRIEAGARINYQLLGLELAGANNNLYRNGSGGHGLIQVLPNGTSRLVTKASQLGPIIVDALLMKVMKEDKVVSELPTAAHLNGMLRSEEFLKHFHPVDRLTKSPLYADDFSLIPPGYHDNGDGKRVLYLGGQPPLADSIDTINRFLDVMDFATNADRTNAVAGALTIPLRYLWLGQKPIVLITATKSHAGKGTTTEFIRGSVSKADVLYQNIDWPMQSQFQRQVNDDSEIGVVYLDNVRLDSAGGSKPFIRSAWIESFITSAEVTLASPGAGELVRLQNRFVFIINTNDGSLSPDLLNRSLPIRLAPKGDVHDRKSPIGDPKLEFLPMNRDQIEAELRGMIECWRKEGCPLDDNVKHPMSLWAKTTGGILKVWGFTDFLANYQTCRATEDPIREALAILAGASPGKALRPMEWAELVVKQGLAKTLFRSHERDTEAGRERAIGVLLSKYLSETFTAITDARRLHVRLDGGQRRWVKKENPHMRYEFKVINEEEVPTDD